MDTGHHTAERDQVRRPVDLHFLTRLELDAAEHLLLGVRRRPDAQDVPAEDAVAALVTLLPDLPQDALGRQALLDPLLDRLCEGGQLARRWALGRCGRCCRCRRRGRCSERLAFPWGLRRSLLAVLLQDPPYDWPGHTGDVRDLAGAAALLVDQAQDPVPILLVDSLLLA